MIKMVSGGFVGYAKMRGKMMIIDSKEALYVEFIGRVEKRVRVKIASCSVRGGCNQCLAMLEVVSIMKKEAGLKNG